MIHAEPLPGWSGRFFHSQHMTFAHYDLAADATPLHTHHHEQEEVWAIVEGRVAITIDGEETELGAGDVAIVPSRHAALGARPHRLPGDHHRLPAARADPGPPRPHLTGRAPSAHVAADAQLNRASAHPRGRPRRRRCPAAAAGTPSRGVGARRVVGEVEVDDEAGAVAAEVGALDRVEQVAAAAVASSPRRPSLQRHEHAAAVRRAATRRRACRRRGRPAARCGRRPPPRPCDVGISSSSGSAGSSGSSKRNAGSYGATIGPG